MNEQLQIINQSYLLICKFIVWIINYSPIEDLLSPKQNYFLRKLHLLTNLMEFSNCRYHFFFNFTNAPDLMRWNESFCSYSKLIQLLINASHVILSRAGGYCSSQWLNLLWVQDFEPRMQAGLSLEVGCMV